MTDPIEQARPAGRWNEKHSYWRLPDGLYFMLPDSVEQAILRYHPDVVRLVEAARGANEVLSALSSDPPRDVRAIVRGKIDDAQAETDAALEPFKGAQDA